MKRLFLGIPIFAPGLKVGTTGFLYARLNGREI